MVAETLRIAIPSGVTDREATELARLAEGRVVLELGAQLGFSTIVLSGSAKRVHSVDWHQGDEHAGLVGTLERYLENLGRYARPNVITHIGRFEEVLPVFRSASFDGCFLDGHHSADSVRHDLALLLRLVKSGGWIACHDYGVLVAGFGVAEGMAGCVARLGVQLQHADSLAWFIKP